MNVPLKNGLEDLIICITLQKGWENDVIQMTWLPKEVFQYATCDWDSLVTNLQTINTSP